MRLPVMAMVTGRSVSRHFQDVIKMASRLEVDCFGVRTTMPATSTICSVAAGGLLGHLAHLWVTTATTRTFRPIRSRHTLRRWLSGDL
eukprot:6879014-Prymnesium_polylepis.1